MDDSFEVDPKQTNWVKISAVIPAELFILWDEVVSSLHRQGIDHRSELVRNGMVLEVLCADFIASRRKQR